MGITDLDQAPPLVETRELTYREAIKAALEDEMRSDERVVLLGEDVGEAGGPFKTSVGLSEAFPGRVLDTPIAENSFVGAALGMAVTGLRPVVEIMFADFLAVASDAIVNEVTKLGFMSANQMKVPLTIRAIGGGTVHFGPQHSATAESYFLQVPGLLVVTASSPSSAYWLLRTAIRSDEPVLFIEHKALYGRRSPVPADDNLLSSVGRCRVVREGTQVTVVASLLMVDRAVQVASKLAASGIDAEVIDVQWVNPLDVDGVAASISKTGRLVLVSEQIHHGSWGTTLISRLTEQGINWKATPRSVSLPPVPVPFSPPLEAIVIPSVERIEGAIKAVLSAT